MRFVYGDRRMAYAAGAGILAGGAVRSSSISLLWRTVASDSASLYRRPSPVPDSARVLARSRSLGC
jgi:hypothetical protein